MELLKPTGKEDKRKDLLSCAAVVKETSLGLPLQREL